jgi:hypothetical protein
MRGRVLESLRFSDGPITRTRPRPSTPNTLCWTPSTAAASVSALAAAPLTSAPPHRCSIKTRHLVLEGWGVGTRPRG